VQLNYFFTPPLHSLAVVEPRHLLALVLLLFAGVLVALVVHDAARRGQQAVRARAEAALLTDFAVTVMTEPDPLRLLLEKVREAFAATSVALLERDRDSWRQVAAASSNPITSPEEAEVDVAVDHGLHLVMSGRVLTGAERHVLRGVAGQALLALRAQRLAAEAVEAGRRAETTELRSALLSAVGHDLRTPLTAIKARPPESVGLVPLPRCRRPPARTTSVGRPGLHPGVGARHGGPRRGGVRGGCPGGGIPAVSRRWLRPSRTADRVESVWSGPQHHSLPVWSRVRALLDLVTGAVDEHSLMTSSTSPYPSVIAALCPHGHGGTAVRVVVETLQAAEGGFSGGEPASACVSVPGLALVPLALEPAGVGVVHVHRHSGQHVRPGRPRVGLVIAQAGS